MTIPETMLSAARPLNVLHLIDTYGTGGAESVFVQLSAGLDSARFRSFPCVLGDGWLRNALSSAGAEAIITPSRGSFDLSYLRRLVSLIRKNKIDVVQTHLITTALYGGAAGKATGVPVVSTFHGVRDIAVPHTGLKTALIRYSAARIVFVSDALRKEVGAQSNLSGPTSMTIHNGVDTARFSPMRDSKYRQLLGISDDEVLVGAVGRVIQAKGFDVLLRAASLLRDHSARVRFVIVGDPLENEDTKQMLEALAGQLALQGVLHFLPFQQDVERVFRNLDVFALTSRTEGFSLTTIEAMSTGLPVVVTASGGPGEIVSPGFNGIMIPVEDPLSLARALVTLADDKNERARLGRNARQTAVERFDLSVTVGRYAALYESLMRRVT